MVREFVFLMSGGRLFHSRGAERLNAHAPMVDCRAGGVFRLIEEADMSDRVGVLIWMRSDRYGGGKVFRNFILDRELGTYPMLFNEVILVKNS